MSVYRNLLILPDGTEIGSDRIKSMKLTASVNSGSELAPGSVCSSMVEFTAYAPGGDLNIPIGTEMEYYRLDSLNVRHRVGLFTAEQPIKATANTYKLTAYDRVSWLDRDITAFLDSLDEWPYSLFTLAQKTCEACLLTLKNTEIPNGSFMVKKFPYGNMTARELMGHIGQLSARFCRATVDGEIEFSWYSDSGVTIRPTGESYYFSLKYEDYQVQKIDAVQVKLADSEDGLPWPQTNENANSYVISGNPLVTEVNENLLPYLEVIRQELQYSVYTPCKITAPSDVNIKPGHILHVVDANGTLIDTYVMSKTTKGQKDTIESVGSARRDSVTASAGKNVQDHIDTALRRQTQTAIFNKLTNNGSAQGLFLTADGQIFVNAAYISTGILQSKDGKTFFLDLDEGILNMDAKSLTIAGKSLGAASLEDMTQEELVAALTADGAAKGLYLYNGQLYINAEYINTGILNASLIKAGILQSKDGGETFKLDLDNGTFHMAGTGKFMAPDGNSYITVDGGSFVMYTKNKDGTFTDIARIGFSEDSAGTDYPFILLGHAASASEEANLGLIKAFSNGVYVGNSVPKLSTGNFFGLPGAAGFFVDVENAKVYNVQGESLRNAFTAVFG